MTDYASPYEYWGENNVDVRNEIQAYIQEKNAEIGADQISVGIDWLNFLTTTAVTLIARRLPGGEVVNTTIANVVFGGTQATIDFSNEAGLQGSDLTKSIVTSLVDAVVTIGVTSLAAGLTISIGSELVLVAAATFTLSQLFELGYDTFVDTLAVKNLEDNNLEVTVVRPFAETLDRFWDSDFSQVEKWKLSHKDEPLVLEYDNVHKNLKINAGGISDDALMDILLRKNDDDFDLVTNYDTAPVNDYVYNFINKNAQELENLSNNADNKALSVLVRLRPFTLESESDFDSSLDQNQYSGYNGDVYVLMLFFQAIRPQVPLRCLFTRFSWQDILLNIYGSVRKAKNHRMSQ